MATIVIDPGHGGTQNEGGSSFNNAVGPAGTLEKNLTLDVGLRLRTNLRNRGHTVLMTRDTDKNLGLKNRANVAKTNAAPVFVSIHFNGSVGHNAQGTETFVHTVHRDISATLCRAVQSKLVAATGLSDRNQIHGGVKVQNLGVLARNSHHASTACCLVEVSFLDRADEEKRLADESYREDIALGLADGIDAYLGLGLSLGLAVLEDEEFGDAIEISAAEAGISVDTMNADLTATAAETGAATSSGYGSGASRLDHIAERVARSAGAGIDADEFRNVPIGKGYDPELLDDADAVRMLLEHAFGGAALESFDFEEFDAHVAALGLRHFRSIEFLFLGSSNQSGKCAGKNALPPRSLWDNISNTALMVDEIRERLGAQIRLLSVFRNQSYNTCIGGESGSLHMRFNAIDFTCSGGTVKEWRDTARDVRNSDKRFVGGIGYYPKKSFIHIDTRGRVADW